MPVQFAFSCRSAPSSVVTVLNEVGALNKIIVLLAMAKSIPAHPLTSTMNCGQQTDIDTSKYEFVFLSMRKMTQ